MLQTPGSGRASRSAGPRFLCGPGARPRTWWRWGLGLARRIALAAAVTDCLVGLGYAALALGDLAVARRCFEEGGGHEPPVAALKMALYRNPLDCDSLRRTRKPAACGTFSSAVASRAA